MPACLTRLPAIAFACCKCKMHLCELVLAVAAHLQHDVPFWFWKHARHRETTKAGCLSPAANGR